MTDTQPHFLLAERKSYIFLILLPIILLFIIVQSMTVLGLDEPLGTPAEVSASKTASSGQVTPGGTVHYTIVISNTGGAEATGMNMTDTLPSEFSVITAEVASLNNATGETVNIANDVVTWDGTLGASTGRVQIEIDAVLTDTAVIGSNINNIADVTGSGFSLSPSAAIEVVDGYKIYLPIVYKPLETPTLLSVGVPTSNDNYATYDMLVSWEDMEDPTLTYELGESTNPDFSNPTIFDAGTETSWTVSHVPSTDNQFYYRVRTKRGDLYSGWSNVIYQVGIYRDSFTDSSTGWAIRREDTDDTNNNAYYEDGLLKLKVSGRWDSMIASPLTPLPQSWPGYRIHTRVRLAEGVDNLHSYGIVFGGDWDGVTPCPASNYLSCFNQYYRLNVVWFGSLSTVKVQLKRIDAHDPENNTDTSEKLMGFREVVVGNSKGWNDWMIDVYPDGTITLYSNGNWVNTVTDTKYIGGRRYFGAFASTDEYLGTAAWHEFYQVLPAP